MLLYYKWVLYCRNNNLSWVLFVHSYIIHLFIDLLTHPFIHLLIDWLMDRSFIYRREGCGYDICRVRHWGNREGSCAEADAFYVYEGRPEPGQVGVQPHEIQQLLSLMRNGFWEPTIFRWEVPQGLILRLLLFMIYTNDFPQVFRPPKVVYLQMTQIYY